LEIAFAMASEKLLRMAEGEGYGESDLRRVSSTWDARPSRRRVTVRH
jgi:hypothetical protein